MILTPKTMVELYCLACTVEDELASLKRFAEAQNAVIRKYNNRLDAAYKVIEAARLTPIQSFALEKALGEWHELVDGLEPKTYYDFRR